MAAMYTVPTTARYASADGKDVRQFTAGDVIDMAEAVRFGMPGAVVDVPLTSGLPAGGTQDAIVEPMDPRYLTGATAYVGINTAILIKFRLARATTATAMSFYIGAASGNVDLGLFTSADGTAFTRLGSTGSTPAAGTNATQTINLTANVPLAAGTNYWAAIAVDNTTLTLGQVANAGNAALLNKTALAKATLFPLASFSTATSTGRAPYLAVTTTG